MDKETPEIAGLTERISKDPKSKLFVPLAEEYRKVGDIDMAIYVLLEGLKNNPGYVTARSSLGKFLLMNGDIAGAQKEFEEVVKAIPDNLMARRKLGDICVLQNRAYDALVHYKTAHSLTPKDEELASLIDDIEAGRDVSSKVQLPKAKTSFAEAATQKPPSATAVHEPAPVSSPMPIIVEPVKPVEVRALSQAGPSASPATETNAPVSVPAEAPSTPEFISPEASIGEPIPPDETPALSQTESQSFFAEATSAPALSPMETEEPEEVLIVELLEPETSVQELTTSTVWLQGGEEPEAMDVPSVVAEESIAFDLSVDSAVPEDTIPISQVPQGTPVDSALDEIVEAASAADAESIVDAESIPEFAVEDTEQTAETVSEPADDFSTDTLAELYIAQGFFEKAIEIYERMLADKPTSRGLQDKLASVRAKAAQMDTPAADEQKAPESRVEQETTGAIPVPDTGEGAEGVSFFDDWGEGSPQQEEQRDEVKREAVAEARVDVPAIEPEEITFEAEVLAEPGESITDDPFLGEDIFPEPASEPELTDQTSPVVDFGFEVAKAAPIKEQSRSKPRFTDFEPREYVPPKQEQEMLTPVAGKEKVTPSGIPRHKETIARLETWLTTIKKEK